MKEDPGVRGVKGDLEGEGEGQVQGEREVQK